VGPGFEPRIGLLLTVFEFGITVREVSLATSWVHRGTWYRSFGTGSCRMVPAGTDHAWHVDGTRGRVPERSWRHHHESVIGTSRPDGPEPQRRPALGVPLLAALTWLSLEWPWPPLTPRRPATVDRWPSPAGSDSRLRPATRRIQYSKPTDEVEKAMKPLG
jgi:hypothetical protein